MRYLIDTNCCIYLFDAAYPSLRARVVREESGAIGLSAIVLAELGVGVQLGRGAAGRQLARLQAEMPCVPFEEADAEAYGRLPFRRARFDRLLAAHALNRGLVLITANERDFADIPGLEVENWTLPLEDAS